MSRLMRAVCAAAGDREATDRLNTVATTAEAIRSNKPVTGWPRLVELLGEHGEHLVGKVCEWLGIGWGAKGAKGDSTRSDGDRPAQSAADVIAAIGLDLDLWHDPLQVGYVTIGGVSHAVRSPRFRSYLVHEHRKRTGRVPKAETLSTAIAAIEAAALYEGREYPTHVRVAGHEGRVYLDLADETSTVIEIDEAGWRPCPSPPVRFRRPPGLEPLPMPVRDGSLDNLRSYLNVPDDDAFALVKAWLAGCLMPEGPFPLLVLLGEQGSAKSTTARVLKRLIDPTRAPLRSGPKNISDLMISAKHGRLLAFDNISTVPPWLSDAFCTLATGGGFSTRSLFTNDDESIFEAKRPLILNGIEDFVTRGDLLERSLLIRHPVIPDSRRRVESELWSEFEMAHPALLGALLGRVSAGMRKRDSMPRVEVPRMADFAEFAVACECGARERQVFLNAYASNRADANVQALEGNPLVPALQTFMTRRREWDGTATQLLDLLTKGLPEHTPGQAPERPRGWPINSNVLGNQLRRLAPNLRAVLGIHVELSRDSHSRRIRLSCGDAADETVGSDQAVGG